MPVDLSGSTNILLRAMSPADRSILSSHCDRVDIERGQVLETKNETIEWTYFLEGGIASVVIDNNGGTTEIGLFGREGASGLSMLLGSKLSANRTFMQVNGSTALRIPTVILAQTAIDRPDIRHTLLRFLHTMTLQMGQTIVANARLETLGRIARWLLMCHDRVDGDYVLLTHDFLAMMIGAQRPSVTDGLHILESERMIRSQRGAVLVLNRAGLEGLADIAYGFAEDEYSRIIAPFGKFHDERWRLDNH